MDEKKSQRLSRKRIERRNGVEEGKISKKNLEHRDSIEGLCYRELFQGIRDQGHALFELCFIESLRTPPLLSPPPQAIDIRSLSHPVHRGVETAAVASAAIFAHHWLPDRVYQENGKCLFKGGECENGLDYPPTKKRAHGFTFQIFICLSNYS